ncbi:unnamed protein product [Protopolystoma xenopodis]|uniref:Uncharacterized protein n=1 Tax=Protopolystoma xenopodis TaxID=117903 RepID=A0A448WMD4_9PLAT|nr:unnamed protein product [Protopolystoma xenopodis]
MNICSLRPFPLDGVSASVSTGLSGQSVLSTSLKQIAQANDPTLRSAKQCPSRLRGGSNKAIATSAVMFVCTCQFLEERGRLERNHSTYLGHKSPGPHEPVGWPLLLGPLVMSCHVHGLF